MGRRGGFIHAVKKAFSCGSRKKRSKKSRKPESIDLDSYIAENEVVAPAPLEEVKLMEAENEQNRHAHSVALATAVAAEAAVAAAHAAAEVVRLRAAACNSGKTKEEIAAIRIQSAYRGYLARRALTALRGLTRLQSYIGRQSVRRQAATTLRYMQTLARLQSEIRARGIRMSVENVAIQREIQQRHEKEVEMLRASIGGDWDDSFQSKEKIEEDLHKRQEAAIRRERALAYAYSHQQTWRNSSNSANQAILDPKYPRWGWSWLERWMAARPWENVDKELNSEVNSAKSTTSHSHSVRGDIKMQPPTAQRQSRPPSKQSPSTPNSKVTSKPRPGSSKGTIGMDDDSRSMNSTQSAHCHRRHSTASSSFRDDESLASSPAVPSYMAPTESARAKARLPSPLGLDKLGNPDNKVPGGSARKRLSFSGSPAGPRRHSVPPKIDKSPVNGIRTNT